MQPYKQAQQTVKQMNIAKIKLYYINVYVLELVIYFNINIIHGII